MVKKSEYMKKGIKGGEKSNRYNLSNQQVENVSVTGGRLNQ